MGGVYLSYIWEQVNKRKIMKNTKLQVVGWILAIVSIITVSGLTIGRTAISEIAGLAVAQTQTQWNNVIDAAKGDGQGSGLLGQVSYMYNGATFDRERGTIANGTLVDVSRISGSITPADAYANPTTANQVWSLNGVFNGTTWDRQRTTTADALASTGISANGNVLFNGSTFDRQDGVSNTNNTATTTAGVSYSTPLTTWFTVPNTTSSAATAATVTKASGGGSVRHVVTGVTFCFQDSAINTVARLVNLRDGASGAGTIIKSWYVSNGGVAGGAQCQSETGLNISGSAATAMTLEFAAAPAATASETVSFEGYSTP
jgi:hypothetical protein